MATEFGGKDRNIGENESSQVLVVLALSSVTVACGGHWKVQGIVSWSGKTTDLMN